MRLPAYPTSSRRRHQRHQSIDSATAPPLPALELAIQEADARKAEMYRRGMLLDSPTLIEHGPIRLLVSASPTDDTLPSYVHTLNVHNVSHVVRVCEPLYDASHLLRHGFQLTDLFFPDGDAPPDDVISSWLSLLDSQFDQPLQQFRAAGAPPSDPQLQDDDAYASDVTTSPASSNDSPKPTVAVHCAAGLGRAPVLAALALVEGGLDSMSAVGWLRALRRGAINATQLAFLNRYVPRPLVVEKPKTRTRRPSFLTAWRGKSHKTNGAQERRGVSVESSPVVSRTSPGSPQMSGSLSVRRFYLPGSRYDSF